MVWFGGYGIFSCPTQEISLILFYPCFRCLVRKSWKNVSVKMASFAAALLDELMGRHRNVAPSEQPSAPKWDDPEVILDLYQKNKSMSNWS